MALPLAHHVVAHARAPPGSPPIPSTICSVNAIQRSSSCTSSRSPESASIESTRACSYRSGSSVNPCRSPTRRYPSGPSSGPGRNKVKSTSNKTAFNTAPRIEARRSVAHSTRRPERAAATAEAVRDLVRAKRKAHSRGNSFPSAEYIGVPRFELGASPTRTERATRLRHTPSAGKGTRVAQRGRPRVCSDRWRQFSRGGSVDPPRHRNELSEARSAQIAPAGLFFAVSVNPEEAAWPTT